MTIKDVENRLNVPRATMRFYEKEHLILPERGENGYRDYSEADVAKLKKIITLRKLGITVQDIEDLFDGEKKLDDVIASNMKEIEEKMSELQGALRLSRVIRERGDSMESFDEEFYWNYVDEEEEKGNRFLEVLDGIARYEKHVVLQQFGLEDAKGGLVVGKGKAIFFVVLNFVAVGLTLMIMDALRVGEWSFDKFKEGLMIPIWWIVAASVFGLPLNFLGKKHPKVAHTVKKVLFVLAFALLGVVLLLHAIGVLS